MSDEITQESIEKWLAVVIADHQANLEKGADMCTGHTLASAYAGSLEEARSLGKRIKDTVRHLPFDISIWYNDSNQYQIVIRCSSFYNLSLYKKDSMLPDAPIVGLDIITGKY